ncbi:MAG: diguanylate cyclase [Magnetococcales bacterium]|nr:diguanylate cyclase [Magnetococcales bacterium]
MNTPLPSRPPIARPRFSVSISARVLISTASAVTLVMLGFIHFFVVHQKETILAQNERTMILMIGNISSALRTIMKAGYAHIAQEFTRDIRKNPKVLDFRILRINGQEAFLDNTTIRDVNRRLGEEEFTPRDHETSTKVLEPDNPDLQTVLKNNRIVTLLHEHNDEDRVTYLAPIERDEKCGKCHGNAQNPRGVMMITTSLAQVEIDIEATRKEALVVAIMAIFFVLLLIYLMIRRFLIKPLGQIRGAMARVASGHLEEQVHVPGHDEISEITITFNDMANRLLLTYTGLQQEQDKLSTIIIGAQEGIVVTDGQQNVVLVNPAAERLLGKDFEQIRSAGWENLVNDPEYLRRFVTQGGHDMPNLLVFNNRALKLHAATIHAANQLPIGTSIMIRDVTDEKKLEDKLRELSITDALTQLYNRRGLMEILEKEIKRSHRYNHYLGFLLFDVDHFKKFNDTYGHDQGDRVLQALGRTMKEHFRKVDTPCRYGGEEFCVILPDTSPRGAYIVAERFRRQVEAMLVDNLKVTVSIGVATIPATEVNKVDDLIKKADDLLYEAKRNGRNQVKISIHLDDMDAINQEIDATS